MPPKPEKTPLENIDLDFTQPKDKLEDLQEKIAATERGIALAIKLHDMERLGDLMAKKQGFEATKEILLAEKQGKPKQEFWIEPDGNAYDNDQEAHKASSRAKQSEEFRKEHGLE